MTSRRSRWVVAVGGLLIVAAATAAGCASEGDDVPAAVPDDADDPAAPAPSGDDTGDAGDADDPLGAHPCDVADVAAIEAAAALALGPGQTVSSTTTENELTWTPDRCSWEANNLEVNLDVAGAGDFADGSLACPPLLAIGGSTSPVDDLGQSAEWEYDADDGEGTLRVCTATALVDAEVEPDLDTSSMDEAGARATAEAAVAPVVADLG